MKTSDLIKGERIFFFYYIQIDLIVVAVQWKKGHLLPESVDGIIGNIGKQRLVDVEDPRILPVAHDPDGLGEGQGVNGDDIRVRQVAVPVHVLRYDLEAFGRDGPPVPGIVGFHGEPPAVAEEAIGGSGGSAAHAEEGVRRVGGGNGEDVEEEERKGSEGLHCSGTLPRKGYNRGRY